MCITYNTKYNRPVHSMDAHMQIH